MARYPLPGDNVFPEGITDGGGTTFYVGSMGDGTCPSRSLPPTCRPGP